MSALAPHKGGEGQAPAVRIEPKTVRRSWAQLPQTVRKLPEFGVKQREERAVRESERWASSAA